MLELNRNQNIHSRNLETLVTLNMADVSYRWGSDTECPRYECLFLSNHKYGWGG